MDESSRCLHRLPYKGTGTTYGTPAGVSSTTRRAAELRRGDDTSAAVPVQEIRTDFVTIQSVWTYSLLGTRSISQLRYLSICTRTVFDRIPLVDL